LGLLSVYLRENEAFMSQMKYYDTALQKLHQKCEYLKRDYARLLLDVTRLRVAVDELRPEKVVPVEVENSSEE